MRDIQTLLVTGGLGFIGSHFIRFVLEKTDFHGKVINLDAKTYAALKKDPFLGDLRYEFIYGNILDQGLIESILSKGVSALIHFAAETHVDRSIDSANIFIESNVKGTLSLLEALRKFPKTHFHHVSTDEVYGSLGETGSFTEESMYQPNSPYSASKAASDHLVRAFAHTYNLSVTLSHCSNNYGPDQYPEKLIPLIIQNCLEGKNLPIYGNGQNVRDWLYVEDHARALWAILERGKKGETYNIGGGTEVTNERIVHEIINLFKEREGKDLKSLITYVKDRPGHDFRYSIDSSKIQNELGWKPQVTLKEGLEKTLGSWQPLETFS